PTQRRKDRRLSWREHRRIRDHGYVGREHLLVLANETLEVRASNLFFTFRDQDDVERKSLACRQVRLERFYVQEKLAFVVNGSARVDLAIAYRWLERRRSPQVERLGRLYIVMSVYEYRRRTVGLTPLTDDNRMTRSGMNARRHTDSFERLLEPFSGARGVAVML